MLHHHNTVQPHPQRTIILGAGGFIGGAILRKLGGASERCLGLARKELDLLDDEAGAKLAKLLRADDALVDRIGARAVQNARDDAGKYPHDGGRRARLWPSGRLRISSM